MKMTIYSNKDKMLWKKSLFGYIPEEGSHGGRQGKKGGLS